MEWHIEYLAIIFLVVTFVFFLAYKKITKDPDALTSKHREERTYPKTVENLDELIRKALMEAGFDKVGYNKDLKKFYASAGFSVWSFGENITVTNTMTDEKPTVHFSSVSDFPTQLVDWGKNKRNSTKFFKELDALTA